MVIKEAKSAKKIIVFLFIFIIILTLSFSMAFVIINYLYKVNINGKNPSAYLTRGPNYQNYINQFYVSVKGTPPNVWSGSTIFINSTIFNYGILYYVLVIYNNLNTVVNLWINGTLPSSFLFGTPCTMYYSPNTNNIGNQWISGQKIVLNPNSVLYLSFNVPFLTYGSGYLSFNYKIGNGVSLTYYYSISANLF
ncbi:MAG: hypothetical protein QXZ18_06530 [Thermoplasmata archaeon]